jgi:hypothetical protein
METDGGIQAVKAARNQALCREVNERIEAISETAGDLELLCECADLACEKTISLSVGEYECIRASSVRFPVALGHAYPEVEDTIEENERFAVVQKRGKAAEVSVQLDPRTRQKPPYSS